MPENVVIAKDIDIATRVRETLGQLALKAPGHSVEVRVPPYAAIQCIEGVSHKRGTPPNVVEMDGDTWLRLIDNEITYWQALEQGLISESGTKAGEIAKFLESTF